MHDAINESPATSGSSPIRRTTAASRDTTSPLSEAEIEPIEEEAAEWMKQLTEVLIDFAYEHIERAR